ncbi:fimbrial protein [Aeromonas piscicola]|uniref:fimbrial protein n=1 Tax=Aeromonas piscicola TaxID=600645 RepID=UPI0021F916FB|nr:fimbrial protein [Aeromonas piscicola]MCW0507634.1 type 1 fimbrial protein [Aeromonas piscicola]
MNMKKNAIAAAIMFVACTNVNAASAAPDQGSGTVEFIGSIIDAPCSVAPESVDQTVQMGEVSNSTLSNYGHGSTQKFNVKLEGCSFDTAKSVDVLFSGIPDVDAKNSLALQGFAKGAAIELSNMSTGDVIELGKAASFSNLTDGTNILKFGATLVSTVTAPDVPDESRAAAIVPGDFNATANFVLTYK